MSILIWFLTVVLLSFFVWAVYRDKVSVSILKQCIVISFLFLLLMCSAIISKVTVKTRFFWILIYSIWIIYILSCSFWYLIKRKHCRLIPNNLQIKKLCLTYKYEIALTAFTLISRIPLLNAEQKWDSSEYYYSLMKACKGFDFSPEWIFGNFNLCGHPSYAAAAVWSIGEFLTPEHVTGALTVQLVLTCIAGVKLFHLFGRHWSDMSGFRAWVSTVICMCIPIFWAGMGCIMPDYLIAVFSVLLLSSEAGKKYVYLVFFSIMICMSKEVGFVLIAGYFAIKYAVVFSSEIKNPGCRADKLKRFIKNPIVVSGLFVAAFAAFYLMLNSGVSQWKHSVYYSDTVGLSKDRMSYNTFSLQFDNITTRMLQFFVANFMWILSFVIVAGMIALVCKHRKKRMHSAKLSQMTGLFGMAAAYMIFMFCYVTAGEMRYNIAFSIFFTAVACVLLHEIIGEGRKSYIAVSFMIMSLFAGQSFYPVDAVTNAFFRVIDVGNTKMMCISQKEHLNPGGDYYINNLQYRNVEKVFEKFMRDIGYQEDDTIMIAGSTVTECTTANNLLEWHGRHSDKYWSTEREQFVNAITKTDELLWVNTITTNNLWGLQSLPGIDRENQERYIQDYLKGIKGRVIVYFSPLFQDDNEKQILGELAHYFYIGEQKQVQSNGFILTYYEMYKKLTIDGIGDDGVFLHTPKLAEENELKDAECTWKEGEHTVKAYNYNRAYNVLYDALEQEEIEKERYRFLSTRRKEVTDGRNVTRAGDTLAVTVFCYDEQGAYINLGCSPKGAVLGTVTLGTGMWLDGIEDALLGRKVSEHVSLNVTFPKNYRNEPKMAGRSVRLEMVIRQIQSETPQKELEDHSMEQIRETMVKQRLPVEWLLLSAVERSQIEVSDSQIESYRDSLKQTIREYASAVKLPIETFLRDYLKLDEQTLEKYAQEYAVYLAKKEIVEELVCTEKTL